MQPNPYIAILIGITMLVATIALFTWLALHDEHEPELNGRPRRFIKKKRGRGRPRKS